MNDHLIFKKEILGFILKQCYGIIKDLCRCVWDVIHMTDRFFKYFFGASGNNQGIRLAYFILETHDEKQRTLLQEILLFSPVNFFAIIQLRRAYPSLEQV